MELQQLRYFLEVAETEHITNSARRLHIAQPALSLAIHRLEDELGVPLFLPRGRGIVLTEYGHFLRDRLTPLVRGIDELPEAVRTMAALSRETVHLNILAASTMVTSAVIEYRASHDNINFRLLQNEESELYDISITTQTNYHANPERKDEYVCSERIFLAVPAGHPLEDRKSIRLDEVKDEGFISLIGSRTLRPICDRFCRHVGFEPRLAFESDNPAAVHNAIAANMGIGFWPEFSWGDITSSNVRLLEIEEPDCRRDLIIRMRRNKGDTACVTDFFNFLCQYCDDAAAKARQK